MDMRGMEPRLDFVIYGNRLRGIGLTAAFPKGRVIGFENGSSEAIYISFDADAVIFYLIKDYFGRAIQRSDYGIDVFSESIFSKRIWSIL